MNYGTLRQRQMEHTDYKAIHARLDRNVIAAKMSKAVQAFDKDTRQLVLEFPSIKEAGRNGFDAATISNCCNGKHSSKSHKGLIWKFKDAV